MNHVCRTFLGVEVGVNVDILKQYVDVIDSALTEFKLPTYYKVRN